MKTIPHSIKVGFVVLALLASTVYAAPAAPAQSADDGLNPGADGYVFAQVAQETMPDGLMSAFLASADGYRYIEQKVIASDGAANDFFGWSVALDGDTALVGALHAEILGAVYIFTRSGTTWSLQQKLTVSDGAGFGASVALSGDTALVGAPAGGPGFAYIFTRIGTTWGQRDRLTASDGAEDDLFGYSVALSGATILVGAYRDDVGANKDQGSAYVFTPDGLFNWEQQAKLTASDDAAGDNFGFSVALDGDTALVGAPLDDIGTNSNQGSAYVFTGSGATWTQQTQLTAADGIGFGFSAALSDTIALVGAPFGQGLAYIFRRIGMTWIQMDKLTASDGAEDDFFGWSVAFSGTTIVVGAPYDDVGSNSDQGSAYVFTPGSGIFNWEQQAKLTASDGAEDDLFGYSVALLGDTALVGAYVDDVSANGQGSAYFYKLLSYAIYLPLVLK
jgi:hypothetical protein